MFSKAHEELLSNIRKDEEVAELNASILSLLKMNEKLSSDLTESQQKLYDSTIVIGDLQRKNENLSAKLTEIRKELNEKSTELNFLKKANLVVHEKNSALTIGAENVIPLNPATEDQSVLFENDQGLPMQDIDCSTEIRILKRGVNNPRSNVENVCEPELNVLVS